MTLIEKLKEALKKAGLSEELAGIISVTEEGQIDSIVQQLTGVKPTKETTVDVSEFLASQAVSEYIQKNGFDSLLKLNKTVQSEHDKKVAQGITTFKNKLLGGEKTPEQIAAEDTAKAGGTSGDNDEKMPAWAKALVTKIEGLEKEKQTESKLDKARKAMESANLPKAIKESWISRINLESETSYEDQIKGLESEYKTIHTTIVGNGTYEFSEDGGGQPNNGKMSEADKAALTKAAKSL